ncbi:short-chain dehydrogenase/reductase [Aspergillus terreus]|uniref:Short-chain dehydrogenase/reductase n=1 Tax=Aspergillus terreus TaxID=33178 RepID=A0A5M3YM93_ASPTE|nr:hypothetical protein ATETN484_0001023600 [Aspergillus terreus]GFF12092.1 short-chain dehydrogenase/reductase [Aspergillus terreus]
MTVLQPQKTALITGAASGVGFATAKICRSRGMHLALLDIDAPNLEKAKHALAAMDPALQTEAYVLDVGDREKWGEVAAQIRATFSTVDLVMLNAGKGYKPQSSVLEGRVKPWGDVEYWKKTFDTNVFGPLNGLEAIIPLLLSSTTPKSIVVTGSKQGITNPPGAGNPAYNASKAAIKSLTEHLAHDLRSDAATAHISVHLLVPGWTWTGLMGNVGPTAESEVKKMAGAWYPSQVAEALVKGLGKGSFYIICPDDETDVALDQARMQWASEDVIEGRPALSRWDAEWKGRAEEAIQADAARRRGKST